MQILSCKISYTSARLLADVYEEITGNKCRTVTRADRLTEITYIRYGSLSRNTHIDSPFNPIEFIELCSNKKVFCDKMIELGILSPYLTLETPTAFPIVVRTTLFGHEGIGIHKIFSEEEYLPFGGHYWTTLYKIKKEYRVHILGKQVSRIFRKAPRVEEGPYPIRNSRNNYHYLLLDQIKSPRTLAFAEQIANAIPCGGKFYALDIGQLEDGRFILLEANTAPGLNYNTAKLYMDYILKAWDEMYRSTIEEALGEVPRSNTDIQRAIGTVTTN